MQVKLSSQNREIISYGTVFLFDENSDLTLNINGDNYFELNSKLSSLLNTFRETKDRDKYF